MPTGSQQTSAPDCRVAVEVEEVKILNGNCDVDFFPGVATAPRIESGYSAAGTSVIGRIGISWIHRLGVKHEMDDDLTTQGFGELHRTGDGRTAGWGRDQRSILQVLRSHPNNHPFAFVASECWAALEGRRGLA